MQRGVCLRAVVAAVCLLGCSTNENEVVERNSGTGAGAGTGGNVGSGGTATTGGGGFGTVDGGIIVDPSTGEFRTDKVDLLFVIDNSSSMADKQAILAETVPDLIGRMATPDCVDSTGTRFGPSTVDGMCPDGGELEFKPVTDIHIAVISSSLGGHGSSMFCNPLSQLYDPTQEDMAHLLTRGPDDTTVGTFQDLGFLAWDPGQLYGGEADLAALTGQFENLVRGVGERGCGFEAPLEASYRFLMDPNPYAEITTTGAGTPPAAELVGTDQLILDQRKSFLRPDSLLAIFTITDENDCSFIDGSQYYAALENKPLWRSTSQCLTDPNDPCCQSCAQAGTKDGCAAPSEDVECMKSGGVYDSALADPVNLRCYAQKQRFGIDMLYPPDRYIAGFQNSKLVDRDGNVVDNPIYSDLQCEGVDCQPARPRSFVFWVGILGVPWQDVAVDPTSLSLGLMSAQELVDNDRWSVILGDPTANPPIPPSDPLMIESVAPRSGTNPVTGDVIAPPESAQGTNPINGHEYLPWESADLQYACIFPIAAARDCSGQGDTGSCDCAIAGEDASAIESTLNPLCQEAGTAVTDSTQRFAKAYPGTRVLQVLKGIDPAQAIVSSICPANLEDSTAPDYGYRPVVPPLLDKLKKYVVK